MRLNYKYLFLGCLLFATLYVTTVTVMWLWFFHNLLGVLK